MTNSTWNDDMKTIRQNLVRIKRAMRIIWIELMAFVILAGLLAGLVLFGD